MGDAREVLTQLIAELRAEVMLCEEDSRHDNGVQPQAGDGTSFNVGVQHVIKHVERKLATMAAVADVSRAPIYTDRSSIVNAFLKAHPEVTKADGFHNCSNSGPFFWIADMSRTEDGKPATIERDDERWSYYGLEVGVARWVVQR
jgi:hypothetical protein